MNDNDDRITLPMDHPYLGAMDLGTYQVIPGLWRVKWRDFLSVKQDAEFDNEKDAVEFENRIRLGARFIDRDLLDDACTTYEEASAFWESLG